MKKLSISVAALLASVATVPANAAPIVYTLSGVFSGTLNGNAFTNYAATFTGTGDTSTRTFKQDANFVTLSSLKAVGFDGAVYTLTDAYEIFSAPSPYGTAGFKTVGGVDKLAFAGPALQTYDNNSSLAPSPVSQYFHAAFATDQGVADITSSTGLTFSAQIGAVPEPATWAMMIAGFGMVGAGLRSRRKQSVRVTYA